MFSMFKLDYRGIHLANGGQKATVRRGSVTATFVRYAVRYNFNHPEVKVVDYPVSHSVVLAL